MVSARDLCGPVELGGLACGLVEEGPVCGYVSCASLCAAFFFCVELAAESVVAG
jgi:hypothetical protein